MELRWIYTDYTFYIVYLIAEIPLRLKKFNLKTIISSSFASGSFSFIHDSPYSSSERDWMKNDFPASVSGVFLIDFRLPVDSNPFYAILLQENKEMMAAILDKANWHGLNHILLVGSSGAGKTSTGFAVAREVFMIYLECPKGATSYGEGYMMRNTIWRTGVMNSYEEVHRCFYQEVCSRLILLLHLCRNYAISPLEWLLFILNGGGRCVGRIYTILKDYQIGADEVNDILNEFKTLNKGTLNVMVDEAQMLSEFKARDENNLDRSALKIVVQAASLIECPFIWAGTRLGINDVGAINSGIGKSASEPTRKVRVVGKFSFCEQNSVEERLGRFIQLDGISSGVVAVLSRYLQGRARLFPAFLSMLVESGVSQLTDSLMEKLLNKLIIEDVIPRFSDEIKHFQGANLVTNEEIGDLWCRVMLEEMSVLQDRSLRKNSLVFTQAVIDDRTDASLSVSFADITLSTASSGTESVSEGDVNYCFEYRYDEPVIQLALSTFIRNNSAIAETAIQTMVRNSHGAQNLGNDLDAIVLLSLICNQQVFLINCGISDYSLNLETIVSTTSGDDEINWFQRVLKNPNDVLWDKCRGVAVKRICILPNTLSGADGICVASKEVEGVVHLKFISFACTSIAGGVSATKHSDQIAKVLISEQFQIQNRSLSLKEKFKRVVIPELSSPTVSFFPILVEIPSSKRALVTPNDILVITEATDRGLLHKSVSKLICQLKVLVNCFVCHKLTKVQCAKCKSVYYCSQDCQRKDWSKHRLTCNKY